jgi:hypothetical protein
VELQYVILAVSLYVLWRGVEKYNAFAPSGMKEIGRKVVRVLVLVSIVVSLWCVVNTVIAGRRSYDVVEPWNPKQPTLGGHIEGGK